MENKKTLIIGAAVLGLLIVSVGFLLLTREPAKEVVFEGDGDVGGDETNSIIVTDQVPGNSVFFRSVTLARDGFVVVREQTNGRPGRVMGSLFVRAVANQSGNVELVSPTIEGGMYYVELYTDTNANGVFDEGVDMAITTALGQTIRVTIETTVNLPEVKG